MIGSFQEFHSLFLHQFSNSKKHRNTELSLFSIHQKEGEPLKEYLQRFNKAALEVSTATQKVKTNAFAQGLLDGDFFKSLAKKPATKFDTLLARVAKYINMEDAKHLREKDGERRGRRTRMKEYVCCEKARGTGPYLEYEIDKDKNVKNPGPGSLVRNISGPSMTGKAKLMTHLGKT
ncbi:UNVERIFIED_CONTAM: hypothetical protein Sangu_0796300 [Sesamum angustifolium]|uniref:Retrotransposon gag domain-containing protein n=1 Tax=Sesamum angustifolium TaxID=2727405 RepID=A0AAW2PVG9_9LAMI